MLFRDVISTKNAKSISLMLLDLVVCNNITYNIVLRRFLYIIRPPFAFAVHYCIPTKEHIILPPTHTVLPNGIKAAVLGLSQMFQNKIKKFIMLFAFILNEFCPKMNQ